MDCHDFKPGDCLLVMTQTMYWVGRVSQVTFDFLTLTEASWVPDTGRLHDAILKGTFNEIEPVGQVKIGIASIATALAWQHDLPKKPK